MKSPPVSSDASARFVGAAIFAVAFAVRLLFWQATPDRGWAGSAWYQGDAALWVEYGAAVERGEPFELGLPLRPPATAYLIAAVSDGSGETGGLRFLWCLLGALTVLVLHLAARRAFGLGVAVTVGLVAAGSSGLLVLSSSLNNETPYLLVVALLLWMAPRVVDRPRSGSRLAWGVLHGVGCLFRVEHAIFVGVSGLWLLARWRPAGGRRLAVHSFQVGMGFVVALLPWHITAWRSVRAFNTEQPALPPAVERAQRSLEQFLASVTWSESARRQADALPAFARRTAADFVAATVAHRGRSRVEEADLGILEEAFGYRPRALPSYPFVALSGGLNFALANQTGADGGFSRAPLEAPPPLAGGPGRYPPALVAGLPPPDLSLTYPPHLRLVNEGYGVGSKELTAHPARAWSLLGAKLQRFWRGAALGWTGYGLPIGLGGRREPVDLVVPTGGWAALWRGMVLVVAGIGVVRAGRRAAAVPWLLFLGSKVLAALAFYGYARQGASVIPVIALLLALAFEPWLPSGDDARRWLAIASVGAALLMVVEAGRWFRPPELLVDGRVLTQRATPPSRDDYGAHGVSVR